MTEWFKVSVLKTEVLHKYHGFESHSVLKVTQGFYMTFILTNHLLEVRNRAIYLLLSLCAIMIVVYNNVYIIFYMLAESHTDIMVFTSITESFLTHLEVTVVCSLILSIPIIYYHVWAFLKPGLLSGEYSTFRYMIMSSFILYIFSLLFLSEVIYPLAIKFFLSYEYSREEFKVFMLPSLAMFVNFYTSIVIPFLMIFQLPMVLYFCIKLRIIELSFLIKSRKAIIILSFIIGAVFSPPDIFSQCLIACLIFAISESFIMYTLYISQRSDSR